MYKNKKLRCKIVIYNCTNISTSKKINATTILEKILKLLQWFLQAHQKHQSEKQIPQKGNSELAVNLVIHNELSSINVTICHI